MADILGFPHGSHNDSSPLEVNPNESQSPPTSLAWSILQDAANLIEGERNDQHGAKEKCHGEIAKLWSWWTGFHTDAHDVAVMLALLKISRIKTGGYNRDCYVDGCGYLSIAGELREPK